jgi:hypothetical protein
VRHSNRSPALAEVIPGPLVALVALARGAWWLTRHAIGPALVILATALVLWHTGRQVIPRPRRYARRVHIAGRATLTALALAAAVFGVTPVALTVAVVVTAAAVAGAVLRRRAYLARRAESDRSPIRVRAHVRQPAGSIPSDQPAAAGTWVYADRARP